METNTFYAVQFYVDGYGYWSDSAEPATNLFALPVSTYSTEAEAQARFEALKAKNPTAQLRVVERTITERVL